MKQYKFFPLLVGFFMLSFSVHIYAQDFKLPEYQKTVLPNGITLYLMEQHEVPLISVSAVMPAGTVFEDKNPGLAAVTADALMFGAGSRSKQKLEEELDFVGATVRTYADKEKAGLNASFAKKDAGLVLGIVRDLIANPQFDASEWEKLQSRLLVQYDQAKESPRSVISSYYDSFVWNKHPYGRSSLGSKKGLESIEIADIRSFYEEHYQPGSTAIAVVGDFNAETMIGQIEELFNSWKGSGKAQALEIPKLPKQEKPRVLLVNKPDATETTFYIGGAGVARNNPDFVPIQVVNTILGGRFTSWLNDELRINSGLTYGARSNFDSYRNGGSFKISSFTKNSSTEDAIDLALKTYGRLHEKGLDKEILASAKNYVKGQFPPRYETTRSLSSLLTDMYWYDFDENFINTFSDRVEKLDVDKANEIIKKYFPKENLQFVLIGKADELRDIAKKWGDVTELEIKNDGFQ